MPFTNSQEAQEKIILPKQSELPTLLELEQLFNDAKKHSGSIELPFGNGIDLYALTVSPHRSGHMWLWTLCRGEGNIHADWSIVTSDPEQIHGLIRAQFPEAELRKGASKSAGNAATLQAIKTSGNYPTIRGVREDSGKRHILDGTLMETAMAELLQSIMVGALTGHLELHKATGETATLVFTDGAPVNCVVSTGDSDEDVIELILWEDAKFFFYPEARATATGTTNRRLELLLMEGTTLCEQNTVLLKMGINSSTVFERVHNAITEAQFEEVARQGTGYDLAMQKRFYVLIDNQSTLEELLASNELSRYKWVPILTNLLQCNLIKPAPRLSAEQEQEITRSLKLDWTQIRAAYKALNNPETNIFAYSSFLFFLRQEFLRHQRFGTTFSVVVLRMRSIEKDGAGVITEEGLPEHVSKVLLPHIERMKREVDIFAHFLLLDFALLLPNTNGQSAKIFTKRLAEDIMLRAERSDLEDIQLKVRLGCASIPDDCNDLEQLIALAQPHFA